MNTDYNPNECKLINWQNKWNEAKWVSGTINKIENGKIEISYDDNKKNYTVPGIYSCKNQDCVMVHTRDAAWKYATPDPSAFEQKDNHS